MTTTLIRPSDTAVTAASSAVPTRGELVGALAELHEREVTLGVDRLATIALACDAWSVTDDVFDPRAEAIPSALFGEQLVSPGAEGTPEVAEFLALELGMALQISPESALSLIGDVLNLRHRLPILWEQALQGRVREWAARRVAQVTVALPLEAVRELDARISPMIHGWTPAKLLREAERLTTALDPEADERRKRARRARHVHVSASGNGMAHISASLDIAAARLLDATLDHGARVLREGGASGDHQNLRADALALLAHPQRAHLILDQRLPFEVAPSGLPVLAVEGDHSPAAGDCRHGAELIVRVNASELRHDGAALHGSATVDALGPVTAAHLREILAGCDRVVVRPIVDVTEPVAVSVYRPSPAIRWLVAERDERELTPFSNRSARSRLIDLDHTIPHAAGGATDSHNLASLSRRAHRAVTHGGFTITQTEPGTLCWTTPAGQRFWTNRHGTCAEPPPDPGRINEPHDTSRVLLQRALTIMAQNAAADDDRSPGPNDRSLILMGRPPTPNDDPAPF